MNTYDENMIEIHSILEDIHLELIHIRRRLKFMLWFQAISTFIMGSVFGMTFSLFF